MRPASALRIQVSTFALDVEPGPRCRGSCTQVVPRLPNAVDRDRPKGFFQTERSKSRTPVLLTMMTIGGR